MEEQHAYKMNTKEKILFALMQLFFIATIFPYNDVLTGFITGGMMLSCVLFNSFKEKLSLLKERKYIIWMFLFFLWVFISVVTSKDLHEGFSFLDPRLPLFYFPLTVGLVNIRREFKERILLGFAVITTVFCAICLISAIINYIRSGNVDYLYSDAITMLSGQQAIYISLLVNFSIYIFCLFIFFRPYRFKAIMIFALLFLFFISFILGSRNMMLVLYSFVLIFLAYYIFKKKKYTAGTTMLIAVLLAGFLVLHFFPKTINRFKDFVYTQYDYQHEGSESHYSKETTPDQWNGANFRIAAWRCGWELFKKNPIAGTHLGDKREKLIEKYKEKNFQFALRTNKNLHNNYLDILVATGIIGLVLFLIAWLFLPFIRAYIYKDYLSVSILVTFAIAIVTEVYFDRSFGGMLFGFFIPFLLSDKKR